MQQLFVQKLCEHLCRHLGPKNGKKKRTPKILLKSSVLLRLPRRVTERKAPNFGKPGDTSSIHQAAQPLLSTNQR